ncbi:MAG TPA: DUF2726 domain-containing protein [Micromonosporaceae bacterium]|nr:DUF2726 domain-containing protein [Micromonosporaceae bacterium]
MRHWLRPVLTESERRTRLASGEVFARGGWIVQPDRRLGQLLNGRPPGITGNQWNSAIRTRFDFVVCDPDSGLPAFAVEFTAVGSTTEAERNERMLRAVCSATGLNLLRIESPALQPDAYGRWLVEYLVDAYSFMTTVSGVGLTELTEGAPSFRDIVGRLPDGRQGFVNDLGAVARVAAMDAYVNRLLTDPLVRGLHVRWQDGPAEGWAWAEVRDGRYLFERTRVWQYGFFCGVELGQLAEDLAVAGIGDRLKTLAVAEPVLRDGADLGRELDQLRLRRDELLDDFAYDHVFFGRLTADRVPPERSPAL